jgi:hypothetical protein
MREALNNFISLNPQNVIEPLFWLLALGWILFLFTTVQSILSQRMRKIWKAFWMLVVVAAPVVGMFAYLVFCLFAADYTFLERFGLVLNRSKR